MSLTRALAKIKHSPDPVSLGQIASTTMKRKLVWEEIIWPLVLENKTPNFTWVEYKNRCVEYYKVDEFSIIRFRVLGPLLSLIEKGIIKKRENDYAIVHSLRQRLKLCKKVSYGLAATTAKTRV